MWKSCSILYSSELFENMTRKYYYVCLHPGTSLTTEQTRLNSCSACQVSIWDALLLRRLSLVQLSSSEDKGPYYVTKKTLSLPINAKSGTENTAVSQTAWTTTATFQVIYLTFLKTYLVDLIMHALLSDYVVHSKGLRNWPGYW